MQTFSLILAICGCLVALAASVVLLIVAFRVSIIWFIVCFLPFGPLIFAIAHWSEARGSIVAYFVGVLMMFGGFALAPDSYKNSVDSRGESPSSTRGAPPVAVPNSVSASREERITQLQARLSEDTASLNALYRDLSARRAALKPGDEKALADYNNEAARYSAKLEATRKDKAELDQLMAKLH